MHVAALQNHLAPLLVPCSRVYAACMAVRRRFWESPMSRAFRPSRPVVSVGNIAWGGTGKTPLVDWLLHWAGTRGLNPAVLTRGYGAKPPTVPFLVGSQHTAEEAGDEPLMLARRNPYAAVLVDPVRRRAGRWAEHELRPHFYLLDDGMQHLAVRRDLDLVVLRPDDVLDQWGRVLPAGSWREGASALKSATAFFVKSSPEVFEALAPVLEERLAPYGVPVFSFWLRPSGLLRVGGNEQRPHFDGAPYVLVSGVGGPGQVGETATRYFGYAPVRHRVFPDHHPYGPDDVRLLAQEGAQLVCTPKDAVKLERFAGLDLWTFDLQTVFGPAIGTAAPFPQWWDERWARLARERAGTS